MSQQQRSSAIPFEATTAYLTENTLDNPSFRAFMEGLNEGQKSRFVELAHHLLYVGFEDGLRRPVSTKEMSIEMQSLQIIKCMGIMLDGANQQRNVQGDR
jgi:hypothetical protein